MSKSETDASSSLDHIKEYFLGQLGDLLICVVDYHIPWKNHQRPFHTDIQYFF